jgi:NAD(P)H-hydrate epimerase
MIEPLYTAAEMRAVEERYPGWPQTVPELMQRAGAAVAAEALRRFPDAEAFTVVCGGGANGGDGRIAAERLSQAGRRVIVVDVKGGDPFQPNDVVVDAIFGTGFVGEPRADAAAAIDSINASGCPVVAVDLPSGVDASTGEVAGAAVRATLTVTFHGRKVGHVIAPGRFLCGDVVVADIGLEALETEHGIVGADVLGLVPEKQPDDTKYTAGHVLVVGGSPGMTGAVCLAAEAALRADCGYVTVAVPRESLPIVEGHVIEAVKRPLDEAFEAAARADAIALGPGLGRGSGAGELVRRLLAGTDTPAVVDADALFGLEPVVRPGPTVLTPHAGELARLLDREAEWVSAHRLEAVREAAVRFGCVVVLKGADTLIAAPGEGVLVAAHGPPALATAGSGDVLTGVLASFLAKRMEPRSAAAAAATACGIAASLGPSRGLVAGDVVSRLPDALQSATRIGGD